MKKSTVITIVGIGLAIGIGIYLYKRRKGVSTSILKNEDGTKSIQIGEDAQQDIVDEGVDSISAILKQQTEMGMNFTEYTNMGGGKSFYKNETEEKLNMGGGDSFYLNEENYSADGAEHWNGIGDVIQDIREGRQERREEKQKDSGKSTISQASNVGSIANSIFNKNKPTSQDGSSKCKSLGIGCMLPNKGKGAGLVMGSYLFKKHQIKGEPLNNKLKLKHQIKMLEKREDKIARYEALKSKLDAIERNNTPEIRDLISSIRAKVNGLALAIGKNYTKEQKDKVLAFLHEIQADRKLRTALVSKAINEQKEIGDVMLEEATANVEANVSFDGAELWTNAEGPAHWGVVGILDGESKGTKKSYVSQPYRVDYSTGLVNFTGVLANEGTWRNCCGG